MSTIYSNPRLQRLSSSFRPYYPADPNCDYSVFQDDCQNTSLALYSRNTAGRTIIDALTRFVIGRGLRPMASPETAFLGWTDEQAERFRSQAESYFRLVTNSPTYDWYGKDTFLQMQATAFRTILIAGDCLLHYGYRKGDGAPFLQLISGRMVTQNGQPDTKSLTGGVILSGGREVGYQIRRMTDNREDSFETRRVSRFNSLGRLEFDLVSLGKGDPSIIRGVPLLTCMRDNLLHLESYMGNHLMQSAVQTLFTGIIEKEREPEPGTPSVYDKLVAANGAPVHDEGGDSPKVELAAGNIIELEPGEHMNIAQRQTQGSDFDTYTKAVIGMMASAAGMSYETAMNTYNASFSASRAGISGTDRNAQILRDEFIAKVCSPVWEQVVEHGIITGRIEAPGFDADPLRRRAILSQSWVGPTPNQVDPVKEITAIAKGIESGILSREQGCRMAYGTDYDETLERIRREERMRSENGKEGEDGR